LLWSNWSACANSGNRNAKYGSEPGVLFYTHLSDQYAPFYTKVINANVRDATHVLDGLLYHESQLRIEEHYTDTAGFTDQVFALCHMLGFEFAPRIADLADKRIYVPGKRPGRPPGMNGVVSHPFPDSPVKVETAGIRKINNIDAQSGIRRDRYRFCLHVAHPPFRNCR
jgi:hypothetical protein